MANEIKYKVGFDVNHSDLNKLKSSLQQLQKLSISDIMKINDSDRSSAITALNDIKRQATNVQEALKTAFNAKLNTVNIETFNKSLQKSNTSIEQIYSTFSKGGVVGENAFRSLTSQVLTTNVQLKETHSLLDNIATTLSNTVKWNLASSAVNTISQSIQQAWGYVKNLDTSLNDIRIVTNKSAEQMANFAVQANQAAQTLGRTTTDYTKAALIYAQQGLSDEEIAERTAVTLKTANVTGQSTAEVSEQLTAVWNGYKVSAEQAEVYVDRLAAVAATTASDLQELSTGMSKVASAAAAMGVGEDQLAAQLSTIISVTRQAPESVGTALRTIYARITDIKAGIAEDEVDLGRYSGKMAALGFNVLDATGNLRDMGQVIEEIGYKWQDLTREQQVSLAQTMAGQRQYSNLIALFDNFDKYTEALNTAQNAAGTLNEQQGIYLESTAAHLNQLKTATEDLYDSLLNPDSLEPLIDAFADILSFAAQFFDSLGGGGALLTSLGAIGVSVFSEQIAKGIGTTITNFEIAKRNAQEFDVVLNTIQQWKGIPGLDQTTRSLLDNREQLLNLSKLMTPEQFSGMQGLLNNITETGNKLASIKDQKGLFDSSLKQIGGFKQQWKSLNNVLKDVSAQEKITSILSNQEKTFTGVSNKLKEYGDTFRQSIGSSQLPDNFEKAKENIGQYINHISRLSQTNGSLKNHIDQINSLKQEYQNLNNAPAEDLPQRLSNITASLAGLYSGAASSAQELREKLEEEFAETVRSLGYSEQQTEEILNRLTKAFQEQQKEIERTAKLKGITDLIGSFSRLGASINQIQNIGKIISDDSIDGIEKTTQVVSNLSSSLLMAIPAVISLKNGLIGLGVAAGVATTLSGVVGALAALVSVGAGVVQYLKAENEQFIKLKQAEIDQNKNKQQQIQNNKKLYSSVEELNKKYKQGQINRIQLRSAVEDLIDQYGIQGGVVRSLAGDYDALTESIRKKRIEAAKQGKDSAQEQVKDANDLILATAKEGLGRQTVFRNNYRLSLGWGSSNKQSEQDFYSGIASYFNNGGVYQTSFNADNIIALYEKISQSVEQVRKNYSEAEREDSVMYQNAIAWLKKMESAYKAQKQASESYKKYTEEENIWANLGNIDQIKTVNDYLKQRQNIINSIGWQKGGQRSAADIADEFLRTNYRELFNRFDERGEYTRTLQQKFRKIINSDEIANEINNLSESTFGKLVDYIDLDNVNSWDQLLSIIQQLSQIDLSNITPITEQGANLDTATDNYTFYQGLEDQIKSGKSISKSEFQRLESSGLQEYFSVMANGQYKMIGDAEQFYNKVNSLKLSGFLSAIDEINKKLEITQNLAESDFNYNQLDRNAYIQREPQIVSNRKGNVIFDEGTAVFDEDLYKRQLQYLEALSDEHQGLSEKIINWRAALEESENDSERLSKLKNAASEIADEIVRVGDQTQNTNGKIEDLTNGLQQAQQALYDALNPTDSDINESQLFGLTQLIRDIADQSNDFDENLDQDARAAQNVAESILRFNNAIEDMVKNYDTWLGVLTNTSVTIQQLAEVMQPLRDAYADLLDIDGSSLSSEFLQSAENLQLMKAAIDGNIESYEQLRQIAAQDIITHLVFNTEQAQTQFETQFENILSWMNDHTAEFKIGASFDEAQYADLLGSLTNLINATQMTAQQASDLLHNAFGIDAQVIQQTKTEPVKHTITGYTANVVDRVIPGTDPLTAAPVTYHIPSIHYSPETLEIEDQTASVGTALKIINAHKSTGGKIKWTHSAQGAGHAGVTRRAAEAEKAAKAAKKTQVKPDTSTKDTKEHIKDDRDIYHDINIEISQINRELERTQKIQDRLFGKQLIANLNKQTDILEKQKVKLREKINLQKLDLAQQKEKLAAMGATFDAEDHISNYFDLLGHQQGVVNGLIDAYNGLVEQYNAITEKTAKDALKDQITEAERQLKKAQDYQKDIETAIKNFDSLRDNMEDLTDEITEISQKQIEINIKRFRMALEIRLDMSEARRDWNQFKREIEQADNVLRDSSTETLIKDVNRSIADYNSYFDVSGSNSIQALTQSLNETMNIIDQIDKMGKDAIYDDDKAQAMQHLKGDLDTLMNSMQSIEGLIQDVDKAILDTVDDVSDLAQKQLEDYDFVNDLYEHDIDLLQLLYGDKQYEAMNAYYGKQQENQLKQIDFLKQYRDLSKQEWDAAVTRGESNLAQKWKKEYMQTVQDLNSAITQSVELLQNKYTNAINKIFDTLDKRITGGLGTDYIEMEWELMNKNANEYLDEINSAFAIQQLQLKYTNIINDDKSLKNQRALQKVLDEQLKNLRDKDKLTQYDVDRAEKILQIEQARLALEDQKKNKTSLRLRRDSQGNYSYVYAANQEQIANAEEALAKAQNDLYNFDKNAYQKNLDDILSAWRDFQSKYKEIVLDTSLSEEQRVRQLALLRDQYGEYINNKVAENEVIRTNLMESAFIDYAALYDGDYNAYQSMIQSEKEALMSELIPTWNNGIQEMANTFVGEGGFIPACQQGFNDLDAATQEYERELDTLQSVADEDFGQLKEGIDDAAEAFSGLITQNDELISKMQNDMINAIRNLKDELDALIAKYQAVYEAAKIAVDEANRYIQTQNAIAAAEAAKDENRFYQPQTVAEQPQSLPAAPTTVLASIPTSTSSGSGTGSGSSTTTPSQQTPSKEEETINPNAISTAEGIAGNIYYGGSWNEFYHPGEQYRELLEQHGFINSLGMTKKKAQKLYDEVLKELGRFHIIEPGPKFKDYYLDIFDFYKMRDKYKWGVGTSGFDTGGYTGSWGPEGRLAFLHQKELVLNADDTKNMLDSVAILRGIVENIGGNISTRLGALNSGSSQINSNRSEALDQNVNIQATFPNVNSKREIEEALNDLVNLAAQRAMKRR